jgi:hypothetical protein
MFEKRKGTIQLYLHAAAELNRGTWLLSLQISQEIT